MTTSTSMCAHHVCGFSRVSLDPRHVHVHQQTDVGLGDVPSRQKSAPARRSARQVEIGGIELEHANAGEPREFLDHTRRPAVAARISRDQDRVSRREQPLCNGGDCARTGRPGAGRAIALLRKRAHRACIPGLGQRFARQHEIHRPLGVAVRHGVGAPQHFLGDDAGGQRPLPLHVVAHDRALVERLLDEMDVRVARAGQLAAHGVGRLARHQEQRDAAAADVMRRHRRVRSADVDVHHHGLPAPRHHRVAGCHVHRGVLVRAQHRRRQRAPLFAPARHLLDQRRVVGAQVAEQVLDADLVQAFEKIVSGRVQPDLRCLVHVAFLFPRLLLRDEGVSVAPVMINRAKPEAQLRSNPARWNGHPALRDSQLSPPGEPLTARSV